MSAVTPHVETASVSHEPTLSKTRRAYARQRPDAQCRRCGMTQEEHGPLRGTLQKHHLVAVRDGGHPTDPSNLFTLCHYCHKEWHTFWEEHSDWPSYFQATPRCQLVKQGAVPTGDRPTTPKAHSCWRCGVSVARCIELRSQRKALGPFNVAKDQIDETKRVCYWCQRDWDIFFKDLCADVTTFSRSQALWPK